MKKLKAEGEASLVPAIMDKAQLQEIFQATPKEHIRTRPAKGGGTWEYVSAGYIKNTLNRLFGWNWDFEIIEEKIIHDEAIVKGRLTCRTEKATIVKMQYGNKDIAYRKANDKGERIPLSIGNDLKSAASDCLKKCAAEIGIAADVYNKLDFEESVLKSEEELETILAKLWEQKKDKVAKENYSGLESVLMHKKTESYTKAITYLNNLK